MALITQDYIWQHIPYFAGAGRIFNHFLLVPATVLFNLRGRLQGMRSERVRSARSDGQALTGQQDHSRAAGGGAVARGT